MPTLFFWACSDGVSWKDYFKAYADTYFTSLCSFVDTFAHYLIQPWDTDIMLHPCYTYVTPQASAFYTKYAHVTSCYIMLHPTFV